MLTEICNEIHNYFYKAEDVVEREFTISDGEIEPLDFLQTGQYYLIIGSTFNDGVWKYGTVSSNMKDEQFAGKVCPMKIPQGLISLDIEIEAWIAANVDIINSPFQSESFGGYSYSKGYSGGTAQSTTWQGQFASRLRQYRKVRWPRRNNDCLDNWCRIPSCNCIR